MLDRRREGNEYLKMIAEALRDMVEADNKA
jgi:hypothetical protein